MTSTDRRADERSLGRKAWRWLRADWAVVDDPLAAFFSALALGIGSWVLLVEGANRVLGAIVLPVTLLMIYRFVRAVRVRSRS